MGTANLLLVALGEPVEWSLLGERILPYAGTFLLTLFFLGAQEEPGWRGFALPRLQERFSPVKATLVLGLIWGVWHVPLYGPVGFVVPMVLAFFYTWVYNRTGSTLMPILLHASFTPAQDHLILLSEETHGTTDVAMGLAYLVGLLVIVGLTRGRLGFDPERNKTAIDGSGTVD
jgi:membrane protease YdiL (CAAX protease family)